LPTATRSASARRKRSICADEYEDGLFSLKLWEKGVLLRTIRLDKLGYSGTLHVEVENRQGFDLLKAAALTLGPPALAGVEASSIS